MGCAVKGKESVTCWCYAARPDRVTVPVTTLQEHIIMTHLYVFQIYHLKNTNYLANHKNMQAFKNPNDRH